MKYKTILGVTLATFITCAVSHAASLTWDKGAANATWDTATSANWTGSIWAAATAAIFGTTGADTVTIASGGVSANSLTFNSAGLQWNTADLAAKGITKVVPLPAASPPPSIAKP